MKILKFGGTSVGSAENIKIVHQIAQQYIQDEVPHWAGGFCPIGSNQFVGVGM
jgi:hypothetical protein